MELTLLSYIDLIVQVVLGFVLVFDYFYLKKRNLKLHSTVMTVAFVVNTILILGVMLPPFIEESTEIFGNLTEIESLLFAGHHFVGLLAELLAGFVVFKFIVKASKPSACKNKNLMRATLTIWLISIILGIVLFSWHLIG